MKFSLFTNDKTTAKDEWILLGFILLCLAVGLTLIFTAPSFWIISKALSVSFGTLWVILGAMFIPGLIYRFHTNDKK